MLVLEGFNVLNATNQTNSATAFIVLEEWSKRNKPELRAECARSQAAGADLRQGARRGRAGVAAAADPRALSQTGGFEFMIEDREGRGVEALAKVTDKFLAEARKVDDDKRPVHPELGPCSRRSRPRCRSSGSTSIASRPSGSTSRSPTSSRSSRPTWAGFYVNDFNLYGKVWKVIIQAEGNYRTRPADITSLYVLNRQERQGPLECTGRRQVRPGGDRRAAL